MTTTLQPRTDRTMTAKELPPDFGTRFKRLRERAGLSQQELATRASVSMSVVFQIEQGKKKDPKLSTVAALAGALGMTVGELANELTRKEPEQKKKPKPRKDSH